MNDPESLVPHWLAQAQEHLHNGNHQLAIDRLKRVLGIQPELGEAHGVLALALLQAHRIHSALHEARLAASCAPESSPTHYCLGRVLIAHRKLKAARAELEQARLLDPEDADVELGLALAAQFAAESQSELVHLQRALALSPESALVLARLADSSLRCSHYDDAERYAREALERQPQHLEALVVMGHVLLRQGRIAEAREHALWALSSGATDMSALGLLVAIKACQNPWLGLWWRINVWLTQSTTTRTIAVLVIAYFIKQVIVIYARQHRMEMTQAIVDYAWLALCIYTWVGPTWFSRQLQAETKTVRLSKSY